MPDTLLAELSVLFGFDVLAHHVVLAVTDRASGGGRILRLVRLLGDRLFAIQPHHVNVVDAQFCCDA